MVVTKPNSGWAVFNYSFVQFHSHSTRIWRLPPQCRACSLTVISPKNFPEAPVPSYCHSRNQTDTRSTSELNPGDPLSQCCFCCDMIPRSSDSYPQLKQIMLTGHFVVPLPIKWSSFTGASSNLSCFFKNWGKWSIHYGKWCWERKTNWEPLDSVEVIYKLHKNIQKSSEIKFDKYVVTHGIKSKVNLLLQLFWDERNSTGKLAMWNRKKNCWSNIFV